MTHYLNQGGTQAKLLFTFLQTERGQLLAEMLQPI